jgi:hypothetical protein
MMDLHRTEYTCNRAALLRPVGRATDINFGLGCPPEKTRRKLKDVVDERTLQINEII